MTAHVVERLGVVSLQIRRPTGEETEGEVMLVLADPQAGISARLSPREAYRLAHDILTATHAVMASSEAFTEMARDMTGELVREARKGNAGANPGTAPT